MTDFRWNFPTSGLALALEGLDALRVGLGLPPGVQPGNALGDRRDAAGAVVTSLSVDDPPAWIGRPGTAAMALDDPIGKTIDIPAKGDPGKYYMHIRTDKHAPGFDPAAYGLALTDLNESAAVLGVWAGDPAP